MEKIKVIHDVQGNTLTVWVGNPKDEHICENTSDEVIIMKDKNGVIIGFELLHYQPADNRVGIAVETMVQG